MNRKRILLKNKSNSLHQNHQPHLQLRKVMMKPRVLKVMVLARSKGIRSSQRRLRRKRMKRSQMGLDLRLRISTPKILTKNQAFPNKNPAFRANRIRLVRPKNLAKILRACLKLRLVAQKSSQFLRLQSSLQA
jgi:hypothetical protein